MKSIRLLSIAALLAVSFNSTASDLKTQAQATFKPLALEANDSDLAKCYHGNSMRLAVLFNIGKATEDEITTTTDLNEAIDLAVTTKSEKITSAASKNIFKNLIEAEAKITKVLPQDDKIDYILKNYNVCENKMKPLLIAYMGMKYSK